MIELLALAVLAVTPPGGPAAGAVAPAAPAMIVVATARGESAVPVATHQGHPALSAARLAEVLPLSAVVNDGWAVVGFADQPFRFLLGAPVLLHHNRILPLVGGAYLERDTLYVPLQWLAEHVPRLFHEGYRYDPLAGRFEEARLATVMTGAVAVAVDPAAARPPSDLARRNGFRMQHQVVLDPGHGGVDNGNPGRYLASGVKEKHVTLAIGRLLEAELERRGVDVIMTRTRDTLIDLSDRARMCHHNCDLFVSIHVNSLRPRRGYEQVNGVETYFLGEALTAEARRVADMENEALRYETGGGDQMDGALEFIFKDLHTNEFLRESALLAESVQRATAAVHPGEDRGVAQNRFVVLATATRPAILLEVGFATNRRDGAYLSSTEGQRAIARAAADGIEAYLKRYEGKVLTGTGQ
ncbi:MAG: N-acetylmuramoyl-L-alanine amidase [Gemmatimonadota bacterium]|nr:MAG: N-acetylmuramoyl-L-alanine amidase [Gemmatimonadota bacterium]